jgi:chorismate synthase
MKQDTMMEGDWCAEGSTYDIETDDGTVTADIMGLTQFKGSEFCKGITTTTTQGFEITSEYYFNQDLSDMWVVTNTMGQINEVHVKG